MIKQVASKNNQNKYNDQTLPLEAVQKVHPFILSDVVDIQIPIKDAALLSNL